ncbi:MAG TPA: DUF6265 family protein [Gemmatimonadaceae bacterium]|nr:DUF6265 family protein [Gemmatimonadaceae bacterium]
MSLRTMSGALLLALSARTVAQSVPAPPARGAPSATARATLSDFSWLAGRWEGKVAGVSGVAEVTYSTPRAGLITGMMRLIDGDSVVIVELITIIQTGTGIELRFRHFSPTLAAYEADFRQTLLLTAYDADRALFENTVPFAKGVMATQSRTASYTRHGADDYTARSEQMGDDGATSVIEVEYHRVKSP